MQEACACSHEVWLPSGMPPFPCLCPLLLPAVMLSCVGVNKDRVGRLVPLKMYHSCAGFFLPWGPHASVCMIWRRLALGHVYAI